METVYACVDCGAEDRDHQGYTDPPAALLCWNCRAGTGLSVQQQVQRQAGMLPKDAIIN